MGKKDTKLGPAASREITTAKHVPYTCHVDPYTIVTENGDYLQVIKLQGISFQTTDNEMLNTYHDQRNTLLRSIAKGSLAIWTTIIRRQQNSYPAGEFAPGGFAQQLNAKYHSKLADSKMYTNDIYISVVLRDVGDLKVITGAKKLKRKIAQEDNRVKTLKAVKQITDLRRKIEGGFAKYEPRPLRTYQHNGVVCSQVIEFFGRLINGRYQRYPISRRNIGEVLSAYRLSFGTETGEVRMVKGCRYFSSLGIKEYYSSTSLDMFDHLLNLPMEFVLTQSFACTNKQDAIAEIQLQRSRLISAGDLSQSQIDELTDALDDLTANRIVAGYHHLSLIVYAPTINELDDNLAKADTSLQDAQIVVAREDLGLEAAFWAQLPGNFSYRTRPALITSRNFSGFSPFHNFPSGHIDGNHWGPAVALLMTESRTPYYFAFHNRGGKAPPGNGSVIGPTGTGKTVFMGFALTMAEKYGGRRIFFDKDFGAKIMVKAAGGTYSAIKKGESTGFNPLQMKPNAKNIEFLKKLLTRMAEMSGGPLTPIDLKEISAGIMGVIKLPRPARKIIEMMEFMDKTRENGPVKRLERWAEGGDRSWVFDNDEDTFNIDADYLGFDMTEVLDDDDLRTPIALYIVHRIKSLIDGTRIIINFDEGWKYARDPILADDLEDFFRTIRKQNGLVIFGTNDAADVGKSEIGKVILQQSQWQIYFPNPKARREDYIENMDLTEKEFDLIRELPTKGRSFLIKRGVNSTVVQLDLNEMDDELAVLSGTTGNVKILDLVIAQTGDDPSDFLPVFHQQRRLN